jgi:hypothetical protein
MSLHINEYQETEAMRDICRSVWISSQTNEYPMKLARCRKRDSDSMDIVVKRRSVRITPQLWNPINP